MSELFDGLAPPRERGTSISGVHSGRAVTHDWITPREIIEALGGADSFDLDPCQSPTQPWPCARRGIVQPQDGLAEPWEVVGFGNDHGDCQCACHANHVERSGQRKNFTLGRPASAKFAESVQASSTSWQPAPLIASPVGLGHEGVQSAERSNRSASNTSASGLPPIVRHGIAGAGAAIANTPKQSRQGGAPIRSSESGCDRKSSDTPDQKKGEKQSGPHRSSTTTDAGIESACSSSTGLMINGTPACGSGTSAVPIVASEEDSWSKITSCRSSIQNAPELPHGTSSQHAGGATDQKAQSTLVTGSTTTGLGDCCPDCCRSGCRPSLRKARVFLNPPYSIHAAAWLAKLARHAAAGGSGTALIFARTETSMFFDAVWGVADAILFLEGRLHFHYPDGKRAEANAGGPSCLIAYGERDAQFLACSGLPGALVGEVSVARASSAGGLLDRMG